MTETLHEQATKLARELFASVDDPRERAELEAIFDRAAEAQRQRNIAWEASRLEPSIGGRSFLPVRRTEGPAPETPPPYGPPSDWAHDGTELLDTTPDGKRVPHGVGYRCLVCRDAGWVRRDVDIHDSDFGKPLPCRCRTENPTVRAALVRDRLLRAGLPADSGRYSLETFQRVKGTDQALNAIYALVTAHRTAAERPRWVVLYGGPGRGKTHLLRAALQQMLPLSEGLAATLGDLLQACKRNQFARDEELTQAAIDAPILLFDEVGNHSEGDWAREKVERILNARYEAQAWTLLGVTVATENVEAWSPRLASRLSDRRLVAAVTLTCPDFRKREVP